MKTLRYLYLMTSIGLVTIMGFAINEDPFIENFKKRWQQYAATYPEEKIYLQLDKPFYKPGEVIWFNAFMLNANTLKPATISDVVYVELKDPKGAIYARQELFAQDGTSRGDITIGDDAPGGIYTISAYTRWSKNYGEKNVFQKQIQVQKVITPRLLLNLDFEKEAYGKGDAVAATLNVKDLQNNVAENAAIEAIISIGGKLLQKTNFTTDATGKAIIAFTLPQDLQTTDGLLQLVVDAKGQKESISRSVPIVLNKIQLAFYPEGGDAVVGNESKIAFTALNEFGKGADVNGVITDQHGNEIASFESFHMGMGSFTLTPAEGKKYFAQITRPIGIADRFELPIAKLGAFGLSAQTTKEKIHCRISSPGDGVVFLIGKTHNEIYYAEKISVSKGSNLHQIDTKIFPIGIATLTLFNAEGLEEAERRIFLNPHKALNIEISTDKNTYAPSENVKVKIKTTDERGNAIAAKLSMAVIDDQLISFADDKQDNILSWMLLSSELKGDIQEPSFYFDKEEPKAEKAIDYLLLTHGWSRYNWKDVLKNDKSIVYVPENSSNLSGIVKNKSGDTKAIEVVLLELGNRRRLAKVKTTTHGQFSFKNIDASTPIVLMTKRPNELELVSRGNIVMNQSDMNITSRDKAVMMNPITLAPSATEIETLEVPVELPGDASMDLTMSEDVTSLSEVVVIGYGTQEKSSMTGSVTVIHEGSNELMASRLNLQNTLQGKVAGIVVTPNGTPGSNAAVRIRGISSMAAWGSGPLFVIDGYAVAAPLNANDNPMNTINPDDIESVTVMHSPEGAAIYGAAGANGVIIITTKSKIHRNTFKTRKPKYTSLIVEPRKFTTTRDFFVPQAKSSEKGRKNFNTTVYWNSTIVTNEKGQAELVFKNSDAASAFRITTEGFTRNGLIGRQEYAYSTQLPLSVDAKIPDYMSFEDTLLLPLTIKNATQLPIEGKITINLPDALQSLKGTEFTFTAGSSDIKKLHIPIVTNSRAGKYQVSVDIHTKDYHDKITHNVEVIPNGFPMHVSFSGKELKRKLRFHIGDIEKGSLQGSLNIYTDVISDLFSGAEGILREPSGCFEQVSSSTYPNVLALQFMKESGQAVKSNEDLALTYIRHGYKKLAAYEISSGGFEWFGHPPAHEGLTAYGLMEFHEMKKVYPDVSDKLIDRTRQWLLDRRNGDGTFKQSPGKYDEFGDGSQVITDAYICMALSETGTKEIVREYEHSLNECWKSKDLYRMALMANTAHNLGRKEDYDKLVAYYNSVSKDFKKMSVSRSVVRGYGESLYIETVAMWSIALMKSIRSDINLINKGIEFILSNRSYGMFGSTQGTILSLKALTMYAQYTRTLRSDGDVVVTANNAVEKSHFTSTTKDKITMQEFSRSLRSGTNDVEIAFDGTQEAMPYSLDVTWNSKTPASNGQCKVRLITTLSNNVVNQNETVRLSCELKNITDEGLPMTMAVIGIPAGLSVQPWQLKELQEKGVFDYYEVLGNKIALYYREMAPKGVHTINLDMKAEVPGTYEGAASSAYLYYAPEFKWWVKGARVIVR